MPSEAGDIETPGEPSEGRASRAEDHVGRSGTTLASTIVQNDSNEDTIPPTDSSGYGTERPIGNGHAANGTNAANTGTERSKKIKGEPPFTKQEREEMEKLLGQLNGTLGQCIFSSYGDFNLYWRSAVPDAIYGG